VSAPSFLFVFCLPNLQKQAKTNFYFSQKTSLIVAQQNGAGTLVRMDHDIWYSINDNIS